MRMNNICENDALRLTDGRVENTLQAAGRPTELAGIKPKTQALLLRMFADPRVLEKQEIAGLVEDLRDAVAQHPKVSNLRVVYGMALCVKLNVHAAIDQFEEGVRLEPDSFIAHLKMGELWMRLRVCTKAETHTHQAAKLAQNMAQSELARRQAASLRIMMRQGIERGGYISPWSLVRKLFPFGRGNKRAASEAPMALDLGN